MRDEDLAGDLRDQNTTTNFRTASDGTVHAYDRATGRDLGMTWQEKQRYDREQRSKGTSKSSSYFKTAGVSTGTGNLSFFSGGVTSLIGNIACAGIVASFILSCTLVAITYAILRDSALFWRGLFSWNIRSVIGLLIVFAAIFFCLRSIARSGRAYKGVFAAAVSAAYVISYHFSGENIAFLVICGLFASIIPIIVLGFIEHITTKKKRGERRSYFTKISQAIVRGNESVSASFSKLGNMFIVGGMMFVLAALFADIPADVGEIGGIAIAFGGIQKLVAYFGL